MARLRLRCVGCGELKRRRWPKHIPMFCSKDCAAGLGFAEATAGGGHCEICGEIGCQVDHSDEEAR